MGFAFTKSGGAACFLINLLAHLLALLPFLPEVLSYKLNQI